MTSVFLGPGYYTKGNFEASDYAGLNQFPAEGCLVEVSAAGTEVDMSGAVLDGECDGDPTTVTPNQRDAGTGESIHIY
jgi:hypothetical protein